MLDRRRFKIVPDSPGLFASLRTFFRRSREDFFIEQIDKASIPKHVAIIMDGNGRWAKQRGLPRIAGHRSATKAIREVIKVAPEIGVKYLTLYTFSVENWSRPKQEVNSLMKLFEERLAAEIDELDKNGVKLNVLGRLKELPDSTRKAFESGMMRTAKNEKLTLNIALNYGGRTEILDVVKLLANQVLEREIEPDRISVELISSLLYTGGQPDPELLIRTSGERRISNFLLWQIAYSELWITPVLWPDFSRENFLEAIYDFQRRKRRFGGLEED
jgi:undecaprenyl diphosphate synthase